MDSHTKTRHALSLAGRRYVASIHALNNGERNAFLGKRYSPDGDVSKFQEAFSLALYSGLITPEVRDAVQYVVRYYGDENKEDPNLTNDGLLAYECIIRSIMGAINRECARRLDLLSPV